MRIELTNGYHIEVDSMNYTLMQNYRPKDKDGNLKEKESVRTLGYFTTLEGALDKFLRLNQIDVLADMGMGMIDYVKKVEESNRMAVQAVKRVLEDVYGQDIDRKSH